jgi:hypothetical protein
MKESKFRLNKVIKKRNLKINTDRTEQDFNGNMVNNMLNNKIEAIKITRET